jgi:hypothetical protein
MFDLLIIIYASTVFITLAILAFIEVKRIIVNLTSE